jgi:hypothetical protein
MDIYDAEDEPHNLFDSSRKQRNLGIDDLVHNKLSYLFNNHSVDYFQNIGADEIRLHLDEKSYKYFLQLLNSDTYKVQNEKDGGDCTAEFKEALKTVCIMRAILEHVNKTIRERNNEIATSCGQITIMTYLVLGIFLILLLVNN